MTKLCPRGKAAAKRKFKVYPSAYANAYASKICAGKIKDPSGVKRKDFRGSKAKGGRIGLKEGFLPESEKNETLKKLGEKKKRDSEIFKKDPFSKFKKRGVPKSPIPRDPRKPLKTIDKKLQMTDGPIIKFQRIGSFTSKSQRGPKFKEPKDVKPIQPSPKPNNPRKNRAGGGLMEATARLKRQGLKGGGICTKGMNRDAVGKNS